MLKKIISGGQTGVDIAALRAAKTCGIETGGYMPFGFLTTTGIKPEYASLYGMKQTGNKSYSDRTRRNVQSPEMATNLVIIIGTNLRSPGTRATEGYASGIVPCKAIQWEGSAPTDPRIYDSFVSYLLKPEYSVVMIAGNRDQALEAPVEAWLTRVFQEVQGRYSFGLAMDEIENKETAQ